MKSPSTRRRFLQSMSATAATMPCFVRGSAMSYSDNPIVGSGDFTYECIHNWDRAGLPAGHEYGNASHGVAIDSQGLIYITHNGNPGSLFVFDSDGKFVKAMGEAHNAGPAAKGHGVSILNRNNEVVAQLGDDENWRKQVLADNFAMRAKPDQWRPGRFVHPHDTCFDSEGNIYITEWVKTGRVTKLVRKA